MQHPLQCRCGQLTGYVANTRPRGRAICYCRDCQSFAYFLGEPQSILDRNGGSDVIPVSVADVHFTKGQEHLACMRLSPNGLHRWYTSCCHTPIGNTPANPRVAYAGLLHNCLANQPSLDETFGPVRIWSFTQQAHGHVKVERLPMLTSITRVVAMIATESLRGKHHFSPFLQTDHKSPITPPQILTSEERDKLKAKIDSDHQVASSF